MIFVGSMLGGAQTPIPSEHADSTYYLELNRTDGVPFRIVRRDHPQSLGMVLVFGGNGETMPSLLWRVQTFGEYGLSAVAMEIPGYGASPGPLGMKTSYSAAENAAEYASKIATEMKRPLFIFGSSIGCFAALHVTSLGFGSKTLLHAPLTSLPDVASKIYWYLPVRSLINADYQFDTTESAETIRLHHGERGHPKVLILHGDLDDVVPQSFGRSLASSLKSAGFFIDAKGYKHNDVPVNAVGPYGEVIYDFFNLPRDGEIDTSRFNPTSEEDEDFY